LLSQCGGMAGNGPGRDRGLEQTADAHRCRANGDCADFGREGGGDAGRAPQDSRHQDACNAQQVVFR